MSPDLGITFTRSGIVVGVADVAVGDVRHGHARVDAKHDGHLGDLVHGHSSPGQLLDDQTVAGQGNVDRSFRQGLEARRRAQPLAYFHRDARILLLIRLGERRH